LAAHRLGEYVEDVVAVLDGAGAGRAALVGYSAGARIAYAVARQYPDRVSAVAGIGSVGAPGDDDSDWAGWAAEVHAGGMRAAMGGLAAEESEPAPGWLLDNLAQTRAEMFALLLEAGAAEPGAWADFPHVQAPALVICGENEEPHAARNARMAADMLPQGTAVVLPGLWHLQAFWRTDQTLPPLTDSSTSTSAPAKNPRLSGEAALATTPVPQRRRRECSHSRGSSRPAPGVRNRATSGRSAHSRPALAMHKHTAWAACLLVRGRDRQPCGEPLITARRAAVM